MSNGCRPQTTAGGGFAYGRRRNRVAGASFQRTYHESTDAPQIRARHKCGGHRVTHRAQHARSPATSATQIYPTAMTNNIAAFATGTPLPVRSGRARTRRGPRRPPAAQLMDAPDESDERGRLERSFRAEMTPKAGSRGECTCIWCNGAKMRRCSWCGGRGTRQEFVNKSWEELAEDIKAMQEGAPVPKEMPKVDVVCSACSGAKQLRCGYCRGSGIGSYGHAY